MIAMVLEIGYPCSAQYEYRSLCWERVQVFRNIRAHGLEGHRATQNQEVVSKTTDLPSRRTPDSSRNMKGSMGWNCDEVGTTASCLQWKVRKANTATHEGSWRGRLPIEGTQSSDCTVAGCQATETKHQKCSLCQEVAPWERKHGSN